MIYRISDFNHNARDVRDLLQPSSLGSSGWSVILPDRSISNEATIVCGYVESNRPRAHCSRVDALSGINLLLGSFTINLKNTVRLTYYNSGIKTFRLKAGELLAWVLTLIWS